MEVTYDISGITAEIPEGSDPEGDDSDAAAAYTEPEPEEGGADPAVEEYDWEVVDDGYTGTEPAEDCGTDDGSEPAEEGTEQADGGSDLEYTGPEPDTPTDSYAVEEVEEPVPEPEWTYYGNCRITHYCDCPECTGPWYGSATASGAWPTAFYTVASGDNLPFGTEIMINDQVYVVQDRGVGNGQIDIFVGDHQLALDMGMYFADVYVRWKE